MAAGAIIVPLALIVAALAMGGGGKKDDKVKVAYDAGYAAGKADKENGKSATAFAEPKNAAEKAYVQGYADGYAAGVVKGGGGGGKDKPPPGFTPTQSTYIDKNGVHWILMNSAPTAWNGTLKNPQPNYNGTPINGSTRAYVVAEIEKRAAAAAAAVAADKKAGYNAGYADGKASCASAGWFGTKAKDANYEPSASTSWRAAYRSGFDQALTDGGCVSDEDGNVTTAGASGNMRDFRPHTNLARRGLPRQWYNM